MLDILTNILSLFFVLGVMIFVHEFGHFATAKYFGVRVDVFSLGFGPRLFGFRRGDTDYRVCALPLGGYVKMKGENPDEEICGEPDEFLSRPKYQRFLVLLNGPLMNVALAFVLFTIVFTHGIQVETWRDDPVLIGWIEPGSSAATTELTADDLIVAVDGDPMPTWQEFELRVMMSGGQEIDLTVQNNTGTRNISVVPERVGPSAQGKLGASPHFPPLIGSFVAGSPAEGSGLETGDRFVEINGAKVSHWAELLDVVSVNPGTPLDFVVDRGGTMEEFTITPAPRPENQGGGGALGVYRLQETELRNFSVVGAMGQSATEIRRQAGLVGEILARLFTGRLSVRTMSGPIEIARYSGAAARTLDPFMLFWFMAVVSLQLGLLNLAPVPVLDGGHIAVILFEGIIRHDLSLQFKERMMTVGVVLLVTFMLVVITFDILKVVGS
jgi:regulator of sigma E protease